MRFPFRFARSYRPLALAFGTNPATAYVEVADGQLRVRYGLEPVKVLDPTGTVRHPGATLTVTDPAALAAALAAGTLGTPGQHS